MQYRELPLPERRAVTAAVPVVKVVSRVAEPEPVFEEVRVPEVEPELEPVPDPMLIAEADPVLDLDDLDTPAYLRQGRLLN